MKTLRMILAICLILGGCSLNPIFAEPEASEDTSILADIDMTPQLVYGTGVDLEGLPVNNGLPLGEPFYVWSRPQTEEIYRVIGDSVPVEEYNRLVGGLTDAQTAIIDKNNLIIERDNKISFLSGLAWGLGGAVVAETAAMVLIIIFGK